MLINDSRTEHRGFRLRQKVRCRYCGIWHRGTITRLCGTKAVVRLSKPYGETRVVSVGYSQLEA